MKSSQMFLCQLWFTWSLSSRMFGNGEDDEETIEWCDFIPVECGHIRGHGRGDGARVEAEE